MPPAPRPNALPPLKTEPLDDDYDDPIYQEDEDEDEDDTEGVDPNDFRPLEQLDEFHWHRRNIAELVDMMNTPYLVLDPSYQRNVVWSKDRMTKLINSLLSNYYVPPLIFNVKKITSQNGQLRYQRICIDGKQRLSSIREFVSGRIPCIDHRRKRWWFCDDGTGKAKKNILPESQKNNFRSLDMLCVEYSELKVEEEEELFSRVQMGMVLTVAEKLRARTGPWQNFAKEVEQAYPDLMAKIDNKRGSSFQAVLSTFRIIMCDDDESPKYATGVALQGFLDKTQLLDEAFKAKTRRIFIILFEIFKKYPSIFENNNYKHSVRFAPIEFIGVALLISRHPMRHIGLLAGDIRAMRSYLREERQELRANQKTFEVMAKFIIELEKYRGGQGVMEIPEDEYENDPTYGEDRKPDITNGKASRKRQRVPLPPPARDALNKDGQLPATAKQKTAATLPRGSGSRKSSMGSGVVSATSNSSLSSPSLSDTFSGEVGETTSLVLSMPPPSAPVAPMNSYPQFQPSNANLVPIATSRKRQRMQEENEFLPSYGVRATNEEEVIVTGYRDNLNGFGTSTNFTTVNIPSRPKGGQHGGARGAIRGSNSIGRVSYGGSYPPRGGGYSIPPPMDSGSRIKQERDTTGFGEGTPNRGGYRGGRGGSKLGFNPRGRGGTIGRRE